MTIEKTYQNCRLWLYKPCPERNNNFMLKTQPSTPPGPILTTKDIEEINKLCKKCSKFEPNIK